MKDLPHRKERVISKHRGQATVISQSPLGVILPETMLDFSQGSEPQPTVVLRSESLGEGHPELGLQLMTEFFQALLDHPEPPAALLLYHSAVRLALDGSPVQDAIRQLAARGCEVLVCKTSLQKLAAGQRPLTGRVAALAELTDRMRQAGHLLWP